MKEREVLHQLPKWIFIFCGVWLIGLGGYFMWVRPPLLPEDLGYLGLTAVQVEGLIPHLVSWLRSVFTVMGGFIAGCGVLTIFVGMHAVPQRVNGTGTALTCAGLLTVVVMSRTNFLLDSDFKWLLLVPPVAWLIGLVCCFAEPRAMKLINTSIKTNQRRSSE